VALLPYAWTTPAPRFLDGKQYWVAWASLALRCLVPQQQKQQQHHHHHHHRHHQQQPYHHHR
jgi:hypothetical protein